MTATISTVEVAASPVPSAGRIRELARSPYFLAGLIILVVFTLTALFGPIFIHEPNAFSDVQLTHPSLHYWLGTNQTGQDVFAQLVVSTRDSMVIGFAAGLIATIVSVTIGVGGGFAGGVIDETLSLFSNVILVIPVLPLVIVISAYVKGSTIWPTVLVVAFTSWAASARILRAQTLSVRNRDYILAARAYGEPAWRVALVEVIPNELPIIISQFIYATVTAILTQATLAFLGLADPSELTWGNMLYFAQNDAALSSGAWWWFVPPGLCIALVGAALTLMNFGLDEVLNPRLRVYREPRGRRGRRVV
jgi:peptide/nickel transport system permease protein